ncbi:hypothetical protein PIB30_000268 [Stylosanthes scabra]|uniref:UBC core domain-containing protein n=1 Tax=Stylosanthes scabra TaxID=79078 RepID=A0ABU6S1W4_9FABA|nr:hypothetical protein [Stylosanthes scabra]
MEEGKSVFNRFDVVSDISDHHLRSKEYDVATILYFNSFGHRLNPNLYNDGKVCPSLLNTWSGKKWDPQGSTLLQAANAMNGGDQIFNGFDMVSEVPDDHYFLSPPSKQAKSYNTLSKHVMKEWKILEQNLPDSIYIRVYENRIDLMRAVIIGAAGTPYHDGLFFFDISLPSDYPNRPPKVYFHSFGYRLNPNLYNNGKVCLSLLNTWHGNSRQMWDRRGSTLLQVLVSIQALVLNEQPFFNEPNAGGWLGRANAVTQKRSRAYSESAFLLTWYVAIKLLVKPPKNFEAFVIQHFRTRSLAVLDSSRDYANGRVWVGSYCRNGGGGGGGGGDGGSSSLRSSNVSVSPYFRNTMVELYPKLIQTFEYCGADLQGTPQNLELEVIIDKQPRKKKVIDRRKHEKKGGIFKKAVDKIKTVLGWKKKKKTDSKQPVVS